MTLATVMFDLAGPQELRVWRIVESGDQEPAQVRLRLRAHIEAGRPIAVLETSIEVEDLPFLDASPLLKTCVEKRSHLQLAPDERGLHGGLFPVLTDRSVAVIVEMWGSKPLGEYQYRLVEGLLQIYRNHLKLLDASEHDPLTGLLNRRGFDEHQLSIRTGRMANANASTSLAERRMPLANPQFFPCLAVIDIDFFKRINDQFGHLYGDEVLVLLARLMRRSFRDGDRLFRFGGEEFVVVVKSFGRAGVHTALERFRTSVESFAFPQVGRITVSIGYTQFGAADGGSDAFGRADKALYVAKAQGRNQVTCYEDLIASGALKSLKVREPEVEYFSSV